MVAYTVEVEIELSGSDEKRVLEALRTEQHELQDHLKCLANAATAEWLDQLLARRLPQRIKDAREVRLLHFALSVNHGQLPRPEQISDLSTSRPRKQGPYTATPARDIPMSSLPACLRR